MRRLAAACAALLALVAHVTARAGPDAPVPQFTDIAAAAGIKFRHVNGDEEDKRYIFEAKGGGAGFFDYDNDGWEDILLVQGSTLERHRRGDDPRCSLFRNLHDGRFADVTAKAGLTHRGWGMGVAFGDYDNDGFVDIYLTYLGPNVLYRNNGDGTFTDVTAKAGVGDPRWSTSAAFGDYDGDGYLDLYVCNYLEVAFDRLPAPGSGKFCSYLGRPVMCGPRGIAGAPDSLYHNNGDGTFTEVSARVGATDRGPYPGLGVVWSDIDGDGDLDILVANDAAPNLLFVNNGRGGFEEKGLAAGIALSGDGREQAGMGVDVADYDNDGRMDAFITHFAGDYSTLYRNQGNLVFEDVTLQTGVARWVLVSWGTRFADFNNDGWKDIYHANGHVYPFLRAADLRETYLEPGTLLLNRGNGTFRDVSQSAGPDFQARKCSRGAAFADFDNDGDIDILVSNLNDAPQLLRNDRSDRNHWIEFRTRGRRSNRDGIGARITVETGGLTQLWEIKRSVGIYSSSDPRAHFGLGGASRVDLVRVRWPSGKLQEFRGVAADSVYALDEDEGLRLLRF